MTSSEEQTVQRKQGQSRLLQYVLPGEERWETQGQDAYLSSQLVGLGEVIYHVKVVSQPPGEAGGRDY